MRTQEIEIDTAGRELIDLTDELRNFCKGEGNGLVNIFVPHATAGLAVIELGDGSEPDFAELMERLLPKDRSYNHHHGSPGHGADHLLPTVFAPSLVVPVAHGAPRIGSWQHVVLVDRNTDNRIRRVFFSLLS